MKPSKTTLPFAFVLTFLLTGSPLAHATVTLLNGFTGTSVESNNADEMAYQANVGTLDLINGLTPVTTGWNSSNGANTTKMTDGAYGLSFAAAGNTVSGGWTTVGATATYDLGAGANGLGYDITSIQSIAAWVNVGFGNQAWTVAVRPVGGSFTDLATIDYQPLSGSGATQVNLNNLNASGIDAIRFTANSVNGGNNGGAFVEREIDVTGVATIPEPASAFLGTLGLGALVLRRRSRAAV